MAFTLRLDKRTNAALSMLVIKSGMSRRVTQSEAVRALILGAANADPDVRQWLAAYDAAAMAPAREQVLA